MKTVEIIRGTFEGRYHAGDRVAVEDQTAANLILERFAIPVGEDADVSIDENALASTEDVLAMTTKKELEAYAASIGMLSLDSSMRVKDMQTTVLNYQDEMLAKAAEQ